MNTRYVGQGKEIGVCYVLIWYDWFLSMKYVGRKLFFRLKLKQWVVIVVKHLFIFKKAVFPWDRDWVLKPKLKCVAVYLSRMENMSHSHCKLLYKETRTSFGFWCFEEGIKGVFIELELFNSLITITLTFPSDIIWCFRRTATFQNNF